MSTFLLVLTLLGTPPSSAPGPLRANEPICDRGDVKAGARLLQTFVIVNRGARTIEITAVNAGCGCMKPQLSKKKLASGDTAEVVVEINTLSQPSGANVWKTSLRYQYAAVDGEIAASELELLIKAKIVREIDVEPIALSFTIDREMTDDMTLIDRRSKPLTITDARCTSKHVKAQVSAISTSGQGQRVQRVHVTVLDSCPPGHFADQIDLITDDEEYRELHIPLTVTRKAPGQVCAAPEQIDIRFAKGQKFASGLVRLRAPDEAPIAIERIEADNAAIRTKWAAAPSGIVTVRLGVDVTDAPTSGLGSVKVHIKAPKPQILVIPVTWQAP